MSDDDRDLRTYSRRTALGLMGIGAGLAATETLGFTNVTADRGVNVGVADDADGVLGVRADEDQNEENREDIDGTFTAQQIDLVFINQSNQTIAKGDLTVEISTDDSVDINDRDADDGDFANTDETIDDGSAQFTTQTDLNEAEEGVLEVDVGSEEEATITVTVVEAVFNGANLSLSRTATLDNTN